MEISVSLPQRERPNIILIVLDSLRADHLPMYGYRKATSPFLENLAAQGTLYHNTISPGVWTLPTHTSLFTGTVISTHQTHRANRYLSTNLTTLAEILRAAGYRCGAVSNNAWVSSLTGLDRGFHNFSLGGRLLRPAELGGEFVNSGSRSRAAYFINKTYRQFFKLYYGDGAPWINKSAMKWVRANHGNKSPFFLFINYKEPHQPFTPPAKYRRMFLKTDFNRRRFKNLNYHAPRYHAGKVEMTAEDFEMLKALYDGEIRYLDACLKKLFTFLEKGGYLENSLIIITSDHGENIGEHGFMGHQYCVYDSLARIPLIVVRPQNFKPGEIVTQQVQLHDVFPTILDVVGIDGTPRQQNQGISLLSGQYRAFAVIELLASAHDLIERRYPDVDSTPFKRTYRALRTERYKLIQASDGGIELYDIATDPSEQKNLAAKHPETVSDLADKLARWVAAHPPGQIQFRSREYDSDIVDRLRSLGYM